MALFCNNDEDNDYAKTTFYENLDDGNLLVALQGMIVAEEIKDDDFKGFVRLLRQKYEIETSDTDYSEDSLLDSFFTAIFQNIFDNYYLQDTDDVLFECGDKGFPLEIKLNEVKRITEEATLKDILNSFSDDSGTSFLVRNQVNSLLSYIIEEFNVRLDLYLFDIQTWSLQKFNSSLNDDNEKEVRPVMVFLILDPEMNVFRSLFFRKKMFANFEDYCDRILENIVEEQEMTAYLERKFSDLETTEFQPLIEKEQNKLENLKSVNDFYKEMLPGYDSMVTNSNFLLLQKYEKEVPEILRDIITQYTYALLSASEFILQCRMAQQREAVRKVVEKEDILILEEDRLYHVINKAKNDNQFLEDELKRLEDELENSEDHKEQLERRIAELKTQLGNTRTEIYQKEENIAWNTFQKELMEVYVSYENLKRGSHLIAPAKTLDELVTAVINVFDLEYFRNEGERNILLRFATKSENNTEANKNDVLEILNLIMEEPYITPNSSESKILEVTGRQIILSQILERAKSFSFSEIRIIAGTVLYIDANIEQSAYHGKNIILTSPIIDVTKNVTINTSGYDGEPKYSSKAQNGCYPGRDGDDGKDADAGESAGNIYINATELRASHHLNIKANGGNGGQGQDGGDGCAGGDGLDGKDGELGDYCLLSTKYEIYPGTSGDAGQNGGNGGNAGLGGGPGCKGQVQIFGSHSCCVENNDGRIGRDGMAGRGAPGGTGGREGVDCGVCWHNYALAGGEWRFAKGKLSATNQTTWYSDGGYQLNILRTEENVRKSRAADGALGRDGELASSRSTQRKTSPASETISESEIAAMTSSVRNQY